MVAGSTQHLEHFYLLWRDIQSDCPQVHLLIVFNAGQDEKKTYVEQEEEGWPVTFSMCELLLRGLQLHHYGNILQNLVQKLLCSPFFLSKIHK